jgi:hypothetical protein
LIGLRSRAKARLSRDLLIRGITYELQERAYGGLSKAVARKLEQTSPDPLSWGAAKPAPPISLKPGTRLVRRSVPPPYIQMNLQKFADLNLAAARQRGIIP